MIDILLKSLLFCVRIIPTIFLSIVLVNMLEKTGWTGKIAWMARPFTKLGKLKEVSGVSFIMSFGSPSAGNAMLMQLYTENKIDRKEMYVASLANTFPAALMHWRSMLPVLIPILGMTGLIYFLIFVFIGFAKTITVLIIGRFILKDNIELITIVKQERIKIQFTELLKSSIKNSIPLMKRILFITVPTTILVFGLVDLGFFERLAYYLRNVSNFFPVPLEGISIATAYIGQSIAAYTIAGNMMAEGIISSKEVILSLLLGQILSCVITAFRYSAPYYIGIFGTKMGSQLLIISSVMRVVFTIIMFYCIYFFV